MSAAEKWEVGASPPTVRVDLKWSLWSKDRGTWEEHAPETLCHLDALGEEGADLTIHTGPKKEIRFGSVHLHFDPKTSTINAHVVFATEWDEFESVADTLGVAEDDEPTRAYLREALPTHAVGGDGAFGVVVEEDVSAPAGETDKLLAAIDAVEDRLLKEDEEAWRSIEASLNLYDVKDEPDLEVGNPQIIAAFREGVVTERIRACGHADCGVSSGIAEELTFGRGHIDGNGYWEIPCRPCAEAFERDHEDMTTAYGVWPSAEDYKRMTK